MPALALRNLQDQRLLRDYDRRFTFGMERPDAVFKNATARFSLKNSALSTDMPNVVKMMTWNVNGYHKPLDGSSANEKRAEVILEADPDILAIQELGRLKAADSFQCVHLGRKAFTHRVIISGNSELNVGLFSRFPIVEAYTHRDRTFTSTKYGPTPFRRDFLVTRLQIGPWFHLTACVFHFKSGDEVNSWRLNEACTGNRIVKTLVYDERFRFTAAVGDANARPQSPTVKALRGSILRDLFEAEGMEDEPTWHGLSSEARLDQFDVSPDLERFYIRGSAKRIPVNRNVSDHDPIVASFRVPKPNMYYVGMSG